MLEPPENCDFAQHNFCAILTFSRNHVNFAVEHSFCATLATFFSVDTAWIQTLTVLNCDRCCPICVIETGLYSLYYTLCITIHSFKTENHESLPNTMKMLTVSGERDDHCLLTTHEVAWYIISIVSVCLSVCQTITFESRDIGSSNLHTRCISREYGSGSYMMVNRPRTGSQEQKS